MCQSDTTLVEDELNTTKELLHKANQELKHVKQGNHLILN